jgi:hypothetical protein
MDGPQPITIDSAVDSSSGRLAARLATLTKARPEEPRNFRGAYPGWLTWAPPQIKNFTHYRLRVGHDDSDPDFQFPNGTIAIQLFKGTQFFISTYNDTNNQESGRVQLEYDADGDLRGAIREGLAEEEVHVNTTMTAATHPVVNLPHPQPGLRLTVFLTQDASGSRTPSWPAFVLNAPTTAIDPTADTLSTIELVYRKVAGSPSGSDAWYCVNYQTGLSVL